MSLRATRAPIEAAAEQLAGPHDLPATVVGGGLALTTGPGRRITIYELTPGAARPIGSFSSAAQAWSAIDALDQPTDFRSR